MSNLTKKGMSPCPVCMNNFTPIIRQPVTCPFCPHAACRQCTSQYLLASLNDPHCMECKREWNRDFIDTKLTQTFRKGALRQHRRKVLMDRERGRLPSMQVYVEAQMSLEAAQIAWNEARIRRATLRNLRGKTQADYGATDTLEQLTESLRPINKER